MPDRHRHGREAPIDGLLPPGLQAKVLSNQAPVSLQLSNGRQASDEFSRSPEGFVGSLFCRIDVARCQGHDLQRLVSKPAMLKRGAIMGI